MDYENCKYIVVRCLGGYDAANLIECSPIMSLYYRDYVNHICDRAILDDVRQATIVCAALNYMNANCLDRDEFECMIGTLSLIVPYLDGWRPSVGRDVKLIDDIHRNAFRAEIYQYTSSAEFQKHSDMCFRRFFSA